MKMKNDFFHDERGIASLEFTLTILIVMLMIMAIYDVLKFQNDMGTVFYNEQVARHRVSLVLLGDNNEKLIENFEDELNELNKNNFLSSLTYFDISLSCFDSLNTRYPVYCGKKIKLLKFSYKVKRKYTDNYISELLKIPVVFEREIFVVNDYYN